MHRDAKETDSKLSRPTSRHVLHPPPVMHVGIANPRWRGKRSGACATHNFRYLARNPLGDMHIICASVIFLYDRTRYIGRVRGLLKDIKWCVYLQWHLIIVLASVATNTCGSFYITNYHIKTLDWHVLYDFITFYLNILHKIYITLS